MNLLFCNFRVVTGRNVKSTGINQDKYSECLQEADMVFKNNEPTESQVVYYKGASLYHTDQH